MRALVGIALVLAGLLGWEWYGWRPPQPPSVEAPRDTPPGPPPKVVVAELPEPERYAVVAERPVFNEDRRPSKGEPVVKEEPTPEEPAPLPQYDLTAILLTPAGKTAWVKKPGETGTERVIEGDQLEGWTVAQIREDRIILERQGEKNTLVLRDFSKTSALAPAPAGAGAKAPRRPPNAQVPPSPPRTTERPRRPEKVANQ